MLQRMVSTGVVLLFLILSANGQEKKEQKPETYTAVAVGVRGPVASRTTNLDFRVSEYTSDEQVEEYLEVLWPKEALTNFGERWKRSRSAAFPRPEGSEPTSQSHGGVKPKMAPCSPL